MNMDYVGTNNIIGRAETDFQEPTKPTGDQSELGEDAFLQLLVTQLSFQDPTNPMDDKELISQLAQFSSLEALNNINEEVEEISSKLDNNFLFSGLSFLGTEIKAPGNEIFKEGDDISEVNYTLQSDSTRTYVNIFDQSGNIVNTIELGAKMSGSYTFSWDGTDFNGNKVPDGKYMLHFGGEGQNGEPVLIDTEVSGKVVGISQQEDTIYLRLEDGREVPMDQVSEVSTSQDH